MHSRAPRQVLRYVADQTSKAHEVVMGMCKPGLKEYQCESTFHHEVCPAKMVRRVERQTVVRE
jgi:hypothetical protein